MVTKLTKSKDFFYVSQSDIVFVLIILQPKKTSVKTEFKKLKQFMCTLVLSSLFSLCRKVQSRNVPETHTFKAASFCFH